MHPALRGGLLALLAFSAAYGPQCAFAATHAAFVRGAVSGALQPWASPSRRVSEAAMSARLAEVVGGGLDAQGNRRIVGVLLHAGAAWVTTGPLEAEQLRNTPFLRLLKDAAAAARADPATSAELLLHFGDSQVNKVGEDTLAARTPVFAVDRWVRTRMQRSAIMHVERLGWLTASRASLLATQLSSEDIPVPNYYVQPDALCAAPAVAWAERKDVLLGRDTLFCQEAGKRLQPFPVCQREFFPRLAQKLGRVGNISCDVAPTNALKRLPDIAARPPVSSSDAAVVKYLLITAGITGAGKLPAALASGGVVMLPRSFAHAYYEHALIPYVHYVPLWERGRDDDLTDKLAWLAAEPEEAAAIGEAGRRFACTHLRAEGRAAYWRELLRRYAATVLAYRVDDALLARCNASVPLLPVTPATLTCDALQAGNHCRWLGARAPAPPS